MIIDFDLNNLMFLLIAVSNTVTAYFVYRSKSDIHRIEVATNSMKDALVASTAKASHAEGREEMRIEKGNSNV